jgi:nitroreductase
MTKGLMEEPLFFIFADQSNPNQMSFLELARKRYSCRNYQDKPVARETLLRVLEAGRVAPSAVNYQPWKIIIITENEDLARIRDAYPRSWFKTAPVALVLCGDHNRSWKRSDGKDHCDIDVAILADHITLAAADAGLGTCWICNFDRKKCVDMLNLPENMEPIIILSLGYPADKADENRHDNLRKSLEEIVQWDIKH